MTGEEIKKFRGDYDLTQNQLAKILNVSENTVARWERNITKEPGFLKLALKTIARNLILAEISKLNQTHKNVFEVRLLSEDELVNQRIKEEIEQLDFQGDEVISIEKKNKTETKV